jgi:tRNA-Thr(GGU) m(6)t(6)A37 methyltransferase TsaA
MSKASVEKLKEQIADLKRRWPAHTVPPAMMEQLDNLEEELRLEEEKLGRSDEDSETDNRTLGLRSIGSVQNAFPDPTTPELIRAADARIILEPALVDGLTGLEPGQQIMIIFYFHRSKGFDLLQNPRGDQGRPRRGVFALRSPQRPNPIGVTVVELVRIDGNVLYVRGLDALDGSPILDIKPA